MTFDFEKLSINEKKFLRFELETNLNLFIRFFFKIVEGEKFVLNWHHEKDWGKEKKFREGQSLQVLDTLFFDFIDLAKKLQPKIVIAENVKGLLLGNAISYVREIYRQFDLAGYYCQHFLLDASTMGVPQRRERVFFIALRKDLATPFLYQKDMFTVVPKLDIKFNEKKIIYGTVCNYDYQRPLGAYARKYWELRKPTDKCAADSKNRSGLKRSDMNCIYLKENLIAPTLTSKPHINFSHDSYINDITTKLISTFPIDYNYNNITYICGMSVPPVMVAQIASEIFNQWLNKL